MGTLRLPRLSTGAAIGSVSGPNVIPSQAFAKWWDQAATAIEGAVASLQTQEDAQALLLQQLQAVQQQQGAQLQLINQALSQSGAGGDTQTQASTVSLYDTGWALGPVVTFQNAATSTNVTTTSRATTAGQTSGAGTMQGNARLQRIVGGVETTLATTTFTITPPLSGDPAYISFNDFGPLNPSTDSATGEVQYRLDLQRVSGCTSTNVGLTTSVTRN